MNEQKKTNKRKILTRILILAACILVIAAVTVTTVFAVNDWGNKGIHIDSGVNQPNNPSAGDDDKKPNEGDDDNKGDDKPTASTDEFATPVSQVEITTGYDFGKNVTLGHWHFHTGLDMKADAGTSVMACLDGTVEKIVTGDHLDGTSVTIAHDNGVKTVYTFIEAKSGLKKGDKVKKGDVIGTVAEANGSEYKLGSHLHFEVLKNGEWADPTDYLNGNSK